MTLSPREALPPLRVYLAGEGSLWKTILLRDDHLPWKHQPVGTLEQADAVFLWAWNAQPTARLGVELGMAVALLKPIYVGVFDNVSFRRLEEELGGAFVSKHLFRQTLHTSVRDAYELAMADVDVSLPEAYVLKPARSAGICKGCGGSFKKEDKIRQSRRRAEAYHADCYVRMKDPDAIDAALFNAALVESLRIDNVQLEQALRDSQH